MVMITLYARQQKRHRCIEQTFGLRGRVRGWDDLGEWHAYYHVRNEVPVYVRYRIQDDWGWCMGMIRRDDMRWEVGGGFRIGSLYTPLVDSCQCMAKPIQFVK